MWRRQDKRPMLPARRLRCTRGITRRASCRTPTLRRCAGGGRACCACSTLTSSTPSPANVS
eukprot:3492802-Prymnesium_polylepis.1